jgi:bla regulator protein BlaR1
MIPHGLAGWSDALRGFAPAVANHVWQSTAFALVAAALAFALKQNHARARYWIWMAASLKFAVPFALLAALGSHFARPRPVAPSQPAIYFAMQDVSEPFGGEIPPAAMDVAAPPSLRMTDVLPLLIGVVWLVGFVASLTVWGMRWRRVARTIRAAMPVCAGREFEALRRVEQAAGLGACIELRMSPAAPAIMEPGIFGLGLGLGKSRPVLAWPEGISARLDEAQLEAVLAHEVCHVRRRDNLTAAIHMLVQAAFWFHPLVWWVGARLVAERERACDEAVLLVCARPAVYAESILKVCEFCVESPLTCVAGVTGADLKQRVVEIMTERVALRLTLAKKLLLLAVGLCAVAVPVVLGQAKAVRRMAFAAIKGAPRPFRVAAAAMIPEIETPATGELAMIQDAEESHLHAGDESAAADPCVVRDGSRFDVVSIRPSKASSGDWDSDTTADELTASGTTRRLIGSAFGLRDFQIAGGPEWLGSETFDIHAKFDQPDNATDAASRLAIHERWVERYQGLLADRFHLQCHMTTKELPVYELVVTKGGAKLNPATAEEAQQGHVSSHGDKLGSRAVATGMTSQAIATMLARTLGRTVIDKTGLTGNYDFTLVWKPEPKSGVQDADPGNPTPELPVALEEQLGLKLVPAKGPVPVLVIDHAEKPSLDGGEARGPTPVSTSAAYVPTMKFDVASVRESVLTYSFMVSGSFAPHSSLLRVTNFDIRNLLSMAYGIDWSQMTGIPESFERVMFNIEAKSDSEADQELAKLSKEQAALEQQHMMQVMLAERFKLKVHWDDREGPIYNLVVMKNGPKLLPQGSAPSTADEPKNYGDRPIPALYQRGDSRTGFDFVGHGSSIADLAKILTQQFGRMVVDKTGLDGKYDLTLRYYGTRERDRRDDENNPPPPLDIAIQDQLGLKLEAAKGSVRTLVVDHIERPTEN